MKRFPRLPFNSLFPKTVITFMVMIFPLYMLNIWFIQELKDIFRNEWFASMRSNNLFYLGSLEQEVRRLAQLKNQYLYDEDIRNLSLTYEIMSDYERYNATQRIKRKLLLLKESSLYVEDAKVYIRPIERTISTDYYDDKIAEQEVSHQLAAYRHPELLHPWNGSLFLSGAFPEIDYTLNRDHSYIFVIGIELSKERLARSLGNLNNESGGAMLVSLNRDRTVAHYYHTDGAPAMAGHIAGRLSVPADAARFNETMDTPDGKVLVAYELSPALGVALVSYVPENAFLAAVNKYTIWLWGVSGFSLVVILAFSSWIYRLIHRPIVRMVKAFKVVEEGNFSIRLSHRANDEFRYLYDRFNRTAERLNVLVHEVYEQQIRSQKAELKQLQSQINPHFLYNSFFVLYRLIDFEDIQSSKQMALYLGEYFQFITQNHADEVTVEQEVQHAVNYSRIQLLRFAGQIEANWGPLPEACKSCAIPRLVLQPLVENAFEHALEDLPGKGLLHIGFAESGADLIITVEDNGAGLNAEKLDHIRSLLDTSAQSPLALKKNGLVNVHRRLQLKYGTAYGLAATQSPLGGLRIAMNIPLEGSQAHVPVVDRG